MVKEPTSTRHLMKDSFTFSLRIFLEQTLLKLMKVNKFCFDREKGWRGTEKYNQGVASQLIVITSSNSNFDGSIMESIRQKAQKITVLQTNEPLDDVEKIASIPSGLGLHNLAA